MRKSKYIIAVCLFSLVVIGIFTFIYFNPFTVNIKNESKAEVVFVYDYYDTDEDANIRETISEEDLATVKEILKGKKTYWEFGIPACGFDENISIRSGDKVLSPACDGCNKIKYRNKYITVSKKEINAIHRIMRKHGAHFPCV